jgi:hypothetical protein
MPTVHNTATATLGLSVATQLIDWVCGGFHGPVPSAAIAAIVIPVAHLVWNYLQTKLAEKQAS